MPRVLSCLEKGASRNLLSSAKLLYLQQLHPMDRDRLGPDFFPSREGPCGSDGNRMNVELFGWRHTEAKWQLLSSSTKPFRMKKELHFAEKDRDKISQAAINRPPPMCSEELQKQIAPEATFADRSEVLHSLWLCLYPISRAPGRHE